MKLNAQTFEDAAERYVGAAIAGLCEALRTGCRSVAAALLDLAEAFLDWAEASAAIGRLYRRRGYAAARSGPRVRRSRLPSGR